MTPLSIESCRLQVCAVSVEYGPGGLPTVKIEYMLFTPQGAPLARGHLPSNAVSSDSVAALQTLLKVMEADAVKYMGAVPVEPAPAKPAPDPPPDEEEVPIANFYTPRQV